MNDAPAGTANDHADELPHLDLGYGRREAPATVAAAEAAIATRRSVRAYLPDKPVPKNTVEEILNVAARAPSGTNVQPWHVAAVTGETKRQISAAVHARRAEGGKSEMGYNYYPRNWFEPYIGRRRKLGWDMYGLLDIKKGDYEKTFKQHGRNFDFFDAPVGLFFHMDDRLEVGSYLDMGLFIQSVMVAARARGLDTCPQAAWVDYASVVKEIAGIPDNHMLICGMCLGYEDTSAVVNQLYSERQPAEGFATFLGF